MTRPKPKAQLTDEDYRTLAAIRHAIKRFIHFSEEAARAAQLTPQQHQALLAIRAENSLSMTVGELSEFLLIQPHSASELVNRLEVLGLVERQSDDQDRRVMRIHLTDEAEAVLVSLSMTHRDELRRLRPLLSELLSKLD